MARAKCTVEFRTSKHGPSAILFDAFGNSINAMNYPRGTQLSTKERARARRTLMKGCAELSRRR
jgi:hypothetical protein